MIKHGLDEYFNESGEYFKRLLIWGIAVGTLSLLTITCWKTPKVSPYKPTTFQGSTYTLIDADSDGDVDVIVDNLKPKVRGQFVAPDMVDWLKTYGQGNYTLLDFMYKSPRITPDLQNMADSAFRSGDDSELETFLLNHKEPWRNE